MLRVIEYRLKGVPDAEPLYRLITTILDHEPAPAKELAALYQERWEIETTLDELKTDHQANLDPQAHARFAAAIRAVPPNKR